MKWFIVWIFGIGLAIGHLWGAFDVNYQLKRFYGIKLDMGWTGVVNGATYWRDENTGKIKP